MDKHDNERPVLSVRVDGSLLQRLDKLCERTGVSRAEIVERCIVLGLEDEEQMVKWLENRISGPILHMLTHPKLVNKVLQLLAPNMVFDEVEEKIHENVAVRRRRGRRKE